MMRKNVVVYEACENLCGGVYRREWMISAGAMGVLDDVCCWSDMCGGWLSHVCGVSGPLAILSKRISLAKWTAAKAAWLLEW